jgi:hypothetical protein
MKVFLRIVAIALVAVLAVGCKKAPPPAPPEKPLVVPATVDDTAAWKDYVKQRSIRWMKEQGKHGRTYATFLAHDQDSTELIKSTQDNIDRGILAGTIMFFGSPDSARMADLIEQAFKGAKEKSLAGVYVVFIGDAAVKDRVQAAVGPTGAEVVFLEAK